VRTNGRSVVALATIHVREGTSQGPRLACQDLNKLSRLKSARAKQVKLPPLIAELKKRKTSECADPARSARLI
jgi:hypothetical protein